MGHYNKDGIEVIDVGGTIDISTAPRLRELLIDLVSKDNNQLIVNLERVEFLDSTGLGVLVGGLKRVRAHDGSLDLVCTQERILNISRVTGLTKVFGIHETVPAGQPLEATRKAAGQVVTLACAEAVAVQAAASITLAALLWPLIPAAHAVAGLASALGQPLPLRPEQQVVVARPGSGGAGRDATVPGGLRVRCARPARSRWG